MTDHPPLGRGLGSLIPPKRHAPPAATPPKPPAAPISMPRPSFAPPSIPVTPPVRQVLTGSAAGHAEFAKDRVYDIPVGLVDPNPHQPRHAMHDESLEDLMGSIRQHGILQPLIVIRVGERYQLIAGERRFRSAQRLGLPSVPAIVRAAKDIEQLELAIVENVQRQDLNPIEEAVAYQRLIDEFGLTQEDVAQKVGKRRTTVANALRLLSLPTDMQQAIRGGRLSASHAKVLLAAVTPDERDRLYRKITDGNLPVRAAASLGQQTTVRRFTRRRTDPLVQAAEDELRNRFGTKVKITKRDKRGAVSIEFYSDDDYQQLLDRLRMI